MCLAHTSADGSKEYQTPGLDKKALIDLLLPDCQRKVRLWQLNAEKQRVNQCILLELQGPADGGMGVDAAIAAAMASASRTSAA